LMILLVADSHSLNCYKLLQNEHEEIKNNINV
jgi:hypothetical protein